MENTTVKSRKNARLTMDELSIFCEQLALILRAGLPLHDGVEALSDNYRSTAYTESFERLNEVVLETGSLYEGMKSAVAFPEYLIEMTGIGEKTGELQTVMEQMAAYYERESKIHRAIQNAITYPLLLIAMMSVLITVLIVQVLPIFEDVMRGMGIGMDSSSGSLMGFGIGVGKAVLIGTGVVIILGLILILLLRGKTNSPVRKFLYKALPPLQKINNKLYASRFAANMAMMLNNGYPLDDSLELISGIINDEEISAKVNECSKLMRDGKSFPEAVEQIGIFDKLHCRMIKVGYQAGQTDRVMAKLAVIYEEDMDNAINRLVSIIEPSLVALMSVIIGAILLSVMLPLLSVMGSMA